VQCEVTGRRNHGRIEPRWFSVRHTELIRIDYSQLYTAYSRCPSIGTKPGVPCRHTWLRANERLQSVTASAWLFMQGEYLGHALANSAADSRKNRYRHERSFNTAGHRHCICLL